MFDKTETGYLRAEASTKPERPRHRAKVAIALSYGVMGFAVVILVWALTMGRLRGLGLWADLGFVLSMASIIYLSGTHEKKHAIGNSNLGKSGVTKGS